MKTTFVSLALVSILVGACAPRPTYPGQFSSRQAQNSGDAEGAMDEGNDASGDENVIEDEDETNVDDSNPDEPGDTEGSVPDKNTGSGGGKTPIEEPVKVPEPPPATVPTPTPEPPKNEPKPVIQKFKVLSLNAWKGLPPDIAKDIKTSGAEIVCIQEATTAETKATATALGADWKSVTPKSGSEYSIVTKYKVVEELGETSVLRGAVGALLEIGRDARINFYCHHGNYVEWGPYFLGVDKKPIASVVQSEEKVRGPQMKAVIEFMKSKESKAKATVLAGDFNTPSHTDYKDMPWPVTTMIHAAGYLDSYRDLHPNNKKASACQFSQKDPGITWTRLAKEEPNNCFDRIDFIYYRGKLKPIQSETLELPTSDHYSVYTTFEIETLAP